jgi:hypothetical protein
VTTGATQNVTASPTTAQAIVKIGGASVILSPIGSVVGVRCEGCGHRRVLSCCRSGGLRPNAGRASMHA